MRIALGVLCLLVVGSVQADDQWSSYTHPAPAFTVACPTGWTSEAVEAGEPLAVGGRRLQSLGGAQFSAQVGEGAVVCNVLLYQLPTTGGGIGDAKGWLEDLTGRPALTQPLGARQWILAEEPQDDSCRMWAWTIGPRTLLTLALQAPGPLAEACRPGFRYMAASVVSDLLPVDTATETAWVDGWIAAADGYILRLEPGGEWSPVQPLAGLRQLAVIPGTGIVLAAMQDGIRLFREGHWETVHGSAWDSFALSMHGRVLTAQKGDRVSITQIVPEVRDIEGYGALSAIGGMRGTGAQPNGLWVGGGVDLTSLVGLPVALGRRDTSVGCTYPRPTGWLPSGQGELVLGSNTLWLSPNEPPMRVSLQSAGTVTPVSFVASDDTRSCLYFTCRLEGRLRLLAADLAPLAREATKVTGETWWELVLPFREDMVLCDLEHPVEVVVPAPAPLLAFASAGKLECVNTLTGERRMLCSSLPETPWTMPSLGAGLLTMVPAQAFTPQALPGTSRPAVVAQDGEIQHVFVDIPGLGGFGQFRWPVGSRTARPIAARVEAAGLETIAMSPTGETPPVAVLFIGETAYLVRDDGTLAPHKGYFRADMGYRLSPDHTTLVVNDRQGCRIITGDRCLSYPTPGRMSPDGRQVWFLDGEPAGPGGVAVCYDVARGEPAATLPLLPGQQWGGPTVPGDPWADLSPDLSALLRPGEFRKRPTVACWLLADPAQSAWVAFLHDPGPVANKSPSPCRFGPIIRTPQGGLIVQERHEIEIDAGNRLRSRKIEAGKLWFVPPGHVAEWLRTAYTPVMRAVRISPAKPVLDPQALKAVELMDVEGVPSALGPAGDPQWSPDLTLCLLNSRGPNAGPLIGLDGGVTMPAPSLMHLHFGREPGVLLAVAPATEVDPAAVPGRQVLVKIDLQTGRPVWHSAPFAGCTGMVPHPGFDVKGFAAPEAAGLR